MVSVWERGRNEDANDCWGGGVGEQRSREVKECVSEVRVRKRVVNEVEGGAQPS